MLERIPERNALQTLYPAIFLVAIFKAPNWRGFPSLDDDAPS
jgi:hypothetical protein